MGWFCSSAATGPPLTETFMRQPPASLLLVMGLGALTTGVAGTGGESNTRRSD